MTGRVAILGCGYVGLALGRRLRDDGREVVGVRRSADGLRAVEEVGMEAVRADVTDAASLDAIPDVDAVVYAVSAGGRGEAAAREAYVEGLRTAVEEFAGREHPPDRFVYTSSTGVYGDHGGDWVDEETPVEPATARQRILVEAERIASERCAELGIDGTVVRLAGLYGPGRYRLERYLEGPVRAGWLNLVHRDDAAGVLQFVLTGVDEDLLVAVDDEPVSKWALADWLAAACGEPEPPKREVDADGDAGRRVRGSKRCSNRLLRSLGYEFRYPTYREGFRDAIAAFRGDSPGEPSYRPPR